MSDHLVDELLKYNSDFQKYKDLVWKMQDDRQDLYGKSKRENKNYAINQLYGKEGIYARNGNALLADLRKIDKQANHNQRHRINFKDKVDPNEYIQSALKEIRKDTTIQNNKIKSNDDYTLHSHIIKRRKNLKGHIYLKKPLSVKVKYEKLNLTKKKYLKRQMRILKPRRTYVNLRNCKMKLNEN